MELSKRRKIFYTPGLISLVLLPLIILIASDYFNRRPKALEILFSDGGCGGDYLLNRGYINIHLSGNYEDEEKIKFTKYKIREIIASKNTSEGVLLIFDDRAKYGTYVMALNEVWLLEESDIVLDGNKIWLYYDEGKSNRLPEPPPRVVYEL